MKAALQKWVVIWEMFGDGNHYYLHDSPELGLVWRGLQTGGYAKLLTFWSKAGALDALAKARKEMPPNSKADLRLIRWTEEVPVSEPVFAPGDYKKP